MKKSTEKLVRARDSHCWHCGTDVDLVIHHRKNRGSGGSKLLDNLANLILVCQTYNFEMESRADVARSARVYKHKLRQTDGFAEPVFDRYLGLWFSLNNEGKKHAIDKRET